MFVPRLQSFVKNFKQKKSYLWNFSCFLCGDVSKGRQRTRGYIYRTKDHLTYKCHHCGVCTSFTNLLKENFPPLFKEYLIERYKETNSIQMPLNAPIKKPIKLLDSVLEKTKSCENLSDRHPVGKYLLSRKIDKDKWHLFYYVLKFKEYTNSLLPNKFSKESIEGDDHPRLLIPFFNSHGKVFAFIARSFGNEEPKYFTIKIDDEAERIYGLERIDYSKRIYVVEGPIDSLFIENCLAVAGSSFDCVTLQALKSNITIIPDNEPRSKEITKIIRRIILKGYSVCLFPHEVKEKDINAMILSGKTKKEIRTVIDQNTFTGLYALAKFNEWKLC